MSRIAAIGEGPRLTFSATLHAEVVAPGSPAQRQAALAVEAEVLRGLAVSRHLRRARISCVAPERADDLIEHDREKLQYGAYRIGCGRDRILAKLWGNAK